MRNTLGYEVNPDWRFIGRLNLSTSDSSLGDFYDGDFAEVVVGYAYRPIENDRLNALLKYTFFYNLPSAGQLTNSNTLADFSQRSHVFSADAVYDLAPWLSVGGKYGLRLGQLKDNRSKDSSFESSLAHLYIARADFHWVHEWDALIEGRVLDVRAAEDRRSGFLLALYRHLNQHVKAGVGYNFTDFSDDLTDLDYRNRGWFFNLVGKF